MQHVSASIITIGDELLIGQVIDTNSAWIGRELNKIGVWIQHRITIGDDREDIWAAIKQEEQSSDIILITGGLGPTSDDITKELLCQYFEGKMILNEAALQNVKDIFAKYNRPLLEANYKQAEVPDICTVLQNRHGTAPGMFFERNGKLFFSMPGVPFEMQYMMETDVLPIIQHRFPLQPVSHQTLLTSGQGESFIAERLKDFEASLPVTIKLAYLPGASMVRLRLTERIFLKEKSALNHFFSELKKIIPDIIVADEDIPIQQAVSTLLLQNRKTLSTAESCTGGYMAHLFTSMPGASQYFYGAVVSYDNSIKENILHVKDTTLAIHGAVSEETVTEMVQNVRQLMNTDYAVAVSGILGPDGGSPEKPVGTVWIAAASMHSLKTKKCQFNYDRKRNMEATATNALRLLQQMIQKEN